MYRLGVRRDFTAWHFLTAGAPGPEHKRHAHRYRLELVLRGRTLDDAGYLVDIDRVRAALDDVVARYRDRTLNELPEFAGLNPSLERFARLLGERLAAAIEAQRIECARVVLWEDDDAWAAWDPAPAAPAAPRTTRGGAASVPAGAAAAPGGRPDATRGAPDRARAPDRAGAAPATASPGRAR
ncbi:MAG TPA: 6-carboxytetrahydropterin synthase [Longimicrobiales bacterium]